jgi:hypothetical protein
MARKNSIAGEKPAKDYDKSIHGKRYDDEQQAIFCEMAQTIGIARAIRELGYPTFPTAVTWMEKRGIEPNHSNIMETARKYQRFYETEDLLATVDNGIAVIEEMYAKVQTPDDAKKLAEAIQKLMNTRLLLEGKANSITEKRETTQQDLEIAELLRVEQAQQTVNEVKDSIES